MLFFVQIRQVGLVAYVARLILVKVATLYSISIQISIISLWALLVTVLASVATLGHCLLDVAVYQRVGPYFYLSLTSDIFIDHFFSYMVELLLQALILLVCKGPYSRNLPL